jgi:glycosyltransferase involved in cell wall biosynthesis
MRILHLISYFRWTERVEPAADLAIAQSQLGHEVRYLCGKNQGADPEDCIQGRAARKGLVYDDRLMLTKHFRLRPACRDLPELKRYIAEFQPDVIHCHQDNAHLLAALAVGRLAPRPLLVRTFYEPVFPSSPGRDWLFCRRRTDGLVVVNEVARRRARGRFRRQPGRVAVIVPGIDVDHFADRHDLGRLEHVEVPPGAFVAGMITHIGKRQRLDLALKAVAMLASRHPELRLLIIGRGKPERWLHEPARRLGIADRVILGGYQRHENLVRAYHTMDVLVYPIHGTDESCRAVREALAASVPVVAPAIGIIPDLVRAGETGFLSEFNSASLAGALEKMLRLDPAARARMAAAATADARVRFHRRTQAEKVVTFYKRLQDFRREQAGRP